MEQGGKVEVLEGTVLKVKHKNEETLWAILEVELAGSRLGNTQTAEAVGDLAHACPGEQVEMTGRWKLNPRYGRQFEVESVKLSLPFSAEGIEKYLIHNKAKGIGPKMARRLVEAFGPATFDVIEHEPEKLKAVEGIGRKRIEEMTRAWKEHQEDRRVETFLLSHGVTPAYVPRVRRAWGEQTVARVTADPYRLAHEVYGFGFKKADEVAKKLGIVSDDPRRVQAGLVYVLSEAQGEGHLYLPMTALVEQASSYLGVHRGQIEHNIELLRHEGRLVHEAVPSEDGVEGHLAVYHEPLWKAERHCAEELRRLSRSGGVMTPEVERACTQVEAGLGITLAEQQRDALRKAVTERLLVITGGPGTGKTTLVKAICQAAKRLGLEIGLAAPTGRAARRMSEATGHESKTLHRLLEFSFQAGGFQRNRHNPLEAGLLVVDEASMIDIHLMRALVSAVPSSCRLVLVGDVDQLPSVGPGDVLSDLIRSGVVPVVRLAWVFRQSQESSIVRNAHRVNQGQWPEAPEGAPGELVDFYYIKAEDAEEVARKAVKVVTERVPKAFGFDPVRDVQVIAPMHKGSAGCKSLNDALQDVLNPTLSREIRLGQRVFREGDRVMQLRNNYEKEVFNGDVGYVMEVLCDPDDDAPTGIRVEVEERTIFYERDELDELTLAYAVTAHKSQGSEYPVVVIVLATAHYVMLERNLLYTAITRAKKLVVLIAMHQALSRAVKNVEARSRHTRLAARLRGLEAV